VTWGNIVDAFTQPECVPNLEPVQVVDFATLKRERSSWRDKLGPGDEDRLGGLLEILFRFSTCGVEYFDNSRLLAEGMSQSPKFTDYLNVCTKSSRGRSVYDQLAADA